MNRTKKAIIQGATIVGVIVSAMMASVLYGDVAGLLIAMCFICALFYGYVVNI